MHYLLVSTRFSLYKQLNFFGQAFGCLSYRTISGLKLLKRFKRLLKGSEERTCLFVSDRKNFHSQSEYISSCHEDFCL